MFFTTQQHTSLLWIHAKGKYHNISACDAPVTAQQSADEWICDRTETPQKTHKRETQGQNALLRGSSFKAQQTYWRSQIRFILVQKTCFYGSPKMP